MSGSGSDGSHPHAALSEGNGDEPRSRSKIEDPIARREAQD
jgi:hypothetical protein